MQAGGADGRGPRVASGDGGLRHGRSRGDVVRRARARDARLPATACWSAGDGALVREAASGAREIRRPAFLRDAVVDAMAAAEGDTVWLGLSTLRDGERWPLGLVRYDWLNGRAHAFRGTDAGPCGFFVHDLQVRDGILWVSTDLGVSRLGISPEAWDEWTHFTSGPGGALEEVSCAGLVAEAMAADPTRVPRWVAEFRPRYWRREGRRAASVAETRHAPCRIHSARRSGR